MKDASGNASISSISVSIDKSAGKISCTITAADGTGNTSKLTLQMLCNVEVPDEPTTEEPSTDAPTTEEPSTDAPTTEEPSTDAPTTEEPSTDAPATEGPSTDEPDAEESSTAAPAPTGETEAIETMEDPEEDTTVE